MSHENVEVVRRAYESFNRGDLDAFADLFDPDATVHPVDYWPDDMIRQGREEIVRLFKGGARTVGQTREQGGEAHRQR